MLIVSMILFSYVFSEPIYCIDSSMEELLAKIPKLEDIEYFQGQVSETNRLFRKSLRDHLPEHIQQKRLIDKKERETNLNVGRKVLRTLRDRLHPGDFNTSLSTSFSLGKRNLDE